MARDEKADERDLAGRYRAIFAQVAEGIVLVEAASKRVVEANPAFLRLLGYREADLPALTLYDLVAHDRASVDANTAFLIREGRNAIGARDYRRRDGAIVPVEVSATALDEPGGALLCVVVRDLTARRQEEARRAADIAGLRASEARLRAAVEGAPLLLFTTDRAGIIDFARGRALATLGLTAREIEGRSAFDLTAGRTDLRDNLHRALGGEELDAIVTLGKHTFTTRYAPLRDADGAIVGMVGVAANSTRRMRAEAAVRRYEAGLTAREQETLTLLDSDLSQRQIAARLGVTINTLRVYQRRIADKLGLDSAAREAIAAFAREQGLLDGTANTVSELQTV